MAALTERRDHKKYTGIPAPMISEAISTPVKTPCSARSAAAGVTAFSTALAIDEHRWPFEATLWRQPPFKKYETTVEQVWFSGAHADVGGGYIVEETRDPMAAYADDITLDWMIKRTKHFYPDFPCDLDPNDEAVTDREHASLHNSRRNIYHAWPFAIRSIANCKTEASFWRHQKEVSRDRHARPIGEMVHISALERFLPGKSASPTGERYMAANLTKVIAWIKETYGHAAGGDGSSGAGLNGEQARLPVMGFQIAGDPAAAMEKHHGRRFFVAVAIDPGIERTGRALYLDVFHVRDWWRRNGGACVRQRTQRIARALRGHHGRVAQWQQRNDLGNDGIERRDHASPCVSQR